MTNHWNLRQEPCNSTREYLGAVNVAKGRNIAGILSSACLAMGQRPRKVTRENNFSECRTVGTTTGLGVATSGIGATETIGKALVRRARYSPKSEAIRTCNESWNQSQAGSEPCHSNWHWTLWDRGSPGSCLQRVHKLTSGSLQPFRGHANTQEEVARQVSCLHFKHGRTDLPSCRPGQKPSVLLLL